MWWFCKTNWHYKFPKRSEPKTKMNANTTFPMIPGRFLIVLDINGLLCFTIHVLTLDKQHPPWVHMVRCGNKMVAPHPNYYQFLQLCFVFCIVWHWDMVINNNAKFDLIVELLLGGEGCEIDHVFVWGVEKC